MPIFEISLKDFSFPANLTDARSTFRFLTTLRYITTDGKFDTIQSVVPGLDSYWECEKAHKGKSNYVRDAAFPKFDMSRIDAWDTLLFAVKAQELHSLQLKVIDIEKTGGWLDKMKEYVGSMIQAYLGTIKPVASAAIPGPIAFVKDTFGNAIDDVEGLVVAKLAGMKGQEFLLFKKSASQFPAAPGGPFSLQGDGEQGKYDVGLQLDMQ
jgi:hypothetical protein